MKTLNNVTGQAITIVSSNNTAITAKSGSLPVFATPFMIALMEEATCVAMAQCFEENETSVGTKINVSHIKASKTGSVITANANVIESDGRKLTFEVTATDENGDVIGKGTIERFVVDSEKFMQKVESK